MKCRLYEIFEGLFYRRLEKCRSQTPDDRFEFINPLYSMVAMVINLCLSMFLWAKVSHFVTLLKIRAIGVRGLCVEEIL